MKLRDQVVKDLVMTLKPENFAHQFGPGLRIENCTINNYCTSKAIIWGSVEMIGGVFHQKKTLKNSEFSRSIFDGVKFLGSYDGVDFGHKEEKYEGKVVDCDFSEAILHNSRIFECPAERLNLPIWPCFSIVNPWQAREYVLSRQWEVRLGITLEIYTGENRACTVSFGDARAISDRCKIGVDELRDLLKDIPGMVMRS